MNDVFEVDVKLVVESFSVFCVPHSKFGCFIQGFVKTCFFLNRNSRVEFSKRNPSKIAYTLVGMALVIAICKKFMMFSKYFANYPK